MRSSLQHHLCKSSEDESSSDDDLPPLLNRIGSKCKFHILQVKVSPSQDLMLPKANKSQACTMTSTRKKLTSVVMITKLQVKKVQVSVLVD